MVDLILTIDFAISSDHPSQFLFEDDYVVIGWDQNPALNGPMTKELYFELGHVTARFGKARMPAFEDWFVRRQKQQRRVEVVAPSFLSVAGLVIGSKRIATVHRRLATRLAGYLPLVIKEVPLEIPPIREAIQWAISNGNDPAIRWVVERLSLIAAEKPAMDIAGNVVPFHANRVEGMSHDQIAVEFQSGTSNPYRS
jgi:LysR family transcriptional regulator, nod-box dependent transcriptional activator